jgi:hypothetical protein
MKMMQPRMKNPATIVPDAMQALMALGKTVSKGGVPQRTLDLVHLWASRDCQRSSGGPFSSFVIVPMEAFKLLQGSLRFHASISHRGGKTHRGFCPDCGSPILARQDSNPDIVAIRTASLDDPSWFNPQADVWTSDAQPWDQMNPVLPKFERYPPQAPEPAA